MIGSPRRREAWLRAAGLRPRSPLFLLVGSVSVGRQGSVVQRGQQELQLFEGTAVATHLVGLGLHHVAQVLQLLEARLALLEPETVHTHEHRVSSTANGLHLYSASLTTDPSKRYYYHIVCYNFFKLN